MIDEEECKKTCDICNYIKWPCAKYSAIAKKIAGQMNYIFMAEITIENTQDELNISIKKNEKTNIS